MKNLQWNAIYSVFEKMEVLTEKLSPVNDDSAFSPEELSVSIKDDELLAIRNDIRTQLDLLRTQLLLELSERDAYFVLFPIVALFDELVQSRLIDSNLIAWPSLQKELFQIDDAGEAFYETLEEILRKPQTLPFVYEVYYFCLNHGFKGRYIGNQLKINEYLKLLDSKIKTDKPDLSGTPIEKNMVLKKIGNSSKYYAFTGITLVVVYLFFNMIAFFSDYSMERQGLTSGQKNSDKPLIHYTKPALPAFGRGD